MTEAGASGTTPGTVHRACPNCGAAVDPGDQYCGSCGAQQSQEIASTPPPSASIPVPALPAPRWTSIAGRTVREAFFDLGMQLLQAGRYTEAATTFQRAEAEPGAAPARADLLLARAAAAHGAGRRAGILRDVLEAVLVDTAARRTSLLDYAFATLDRESAALQRRWVIDEWWPRLQSGKLPLADRGRARLVAARAALLLGEVEEACDIIAGATADGSAATESRELAWVADRLPDLWAPDHVEPGLIATPADVATLAAKLWRAAGRPESGLTGLDDALAEITGANYPDAPLRALRGELLQLLGRDDDAASAFHEAGNRYSWRSEHGLAVRWLRRAAELDAQRPDVWWSQADALMCQSFERGLSTEQRRSMAQEGHTAWQRGYALRRPDKSDAWAYASFAFIVTREAELAEKPNREPALWQAVTLVERSLLLTPKDATRWGNLSRFHRPLMNQHSALQAAANGHALDPQDWESLSELLIGQVNMGFWTDATQSVDKLEAIRRDGWTAFVAARLHLYNGRLDAAVERIREAVASDPANMEYQTSHALTLLRAGHAEEARTQLDAILQVCNADERENRSYCSWAASESGNHELALHLRQLDLADAADVFSMESCLRDTAVSQLLLGNVDAARDAFQRGTQSPIDPESRWLAEDEFGALERNAALWRGGKVRHDILDEFRARLRALKSSVASNAREELTRALDAAQRGSWQWIGAQAALARMDREAGDPALAERYALLFKEAREQFPEAESALQASSTS